MTAVANISRSSAAWEGSSHYFLAGVEVGPGLIRAAIFSEGFELIGKAKLSTKSNRGPAAVLERIARCVEYTADECDLRVEDIRAVGVGLPGRVDSEKGLARSATALGWKDVPVRNALEKLLRLPVFVENQFRLGTLGLFTREIEFSANRFAALFLGPEIGGGFIINGGVAATDPAENAPTSLPGSDGIFATVRHPGFLQVQTRDLRKAVRKGNGPARQFARAIAAKAGEVSAAIVKSFAPEVIALGGGLVEEMRDEMLAIVQEIATGGSSRETAVRFFPSALGELAALAGGATLAAKRLALFG